MMEENAEDKLSENERKQEVENIAKQNTKKDSETAVETKDKKIKDIDDIIAGDEVLSYGIKKLQDIGFSADYFKRLVKLQSSFSVGENEEQLISSARNVFNALVIKITDDPNGIVLNKDGSINVRKSERQKAEIEKINDVFSRTPLLSKDKSKTIFAEVFKSINKQKEEKSLTTQFIENNFYKSDFFEQNMKRRASKDDVENSNLDEDFKKMIENAMDNIDKSDHLKMRVIYLNNQIEKDPLRCDKYIKDLDEILQEHPEYEDDLIKLRDPNNKEASKYLKEYDSYNEDLVKVVVFNTLDMIDGLNDEQIRNLDDRFKMKFLATLSMSAVKFLGEGQAKTIDERVKKLGFDINFEKICGSDSKEIQKLGKMLGYNDFDSFKLMELGENLVSQMGPIINKSRVEDNLEKTEDLGQILDELFTDYFDNNAEKIVFNETREQEYFIGSKLELSDVEESEFKKVYSENLINSWISSKDEVLEKMYLGLVNRKEECIDEKNEGTKTISKYQDSKILWLDKAINDFKEKYPNFDESKYLDDNGRLKKDLKDDIKEFERAKFWGDLLKNYVESESEVRSYEDYEKLPQLEKQKYLRDTLAGLSNEKNSAINKFAMRRLECISDKEKSFIEFDENNNPIINKKAVENECGKVMSVGKVDYDSLINSAVSRKNNHVRNKLLKAARMPEECFTELTADTPEAKVAEIEKNRLRNKSIDKSRLTLGKSQKSIKYTRNTVRENKSNQAEKFEIEGKDNTLSMDERKSIGENNELANKQENELKANDKKTGILSTIVEKVKSAFNRITRKHKLLSEGNLNIESSPSVEDNQNKGTLCEQVQIDESKAIEALKEQRAQRMQAREKSESDIVK